LYGQKIQILTSSKNILRR